MTQGLKCYKCDKFVEEIHFTDCSDGFGIEIYCSECLIELAKFGFYDDVLNCVCGNRMDLLTPEHKVCDVVDDDGILCYICEQCPDTNFVGLHATQPDEIDDEVWEGKVAPDDMIREYIYDIDYVDFYNRYCPILYNKRYSSDWGEIFGVY